MKGNMLLGMARGSIGDVVYARVKGQQVGHARNRAPQNPKTTGQMTQRSLFLDAVKFFTRGTQNLFKFAFESKKQTESDFNAFMRYNAKNGINISKAAFDMVSFPAIGDWVLSQGSLKSPNFSVERSSGSDICMISFSNYTGGELTTLGDVSKAFIADCNCKDGDFVTVVMISADGSNQTNTPVIIPSQRNPILWKITQFQIDKSSDLPFTSVAGFEDWEDSGTSLWCDVESTDYCLGFGVVISRKTSSGLKVSSCVLQNNQTAKTCIENGKKNTYIDEVLASWSSNSYSILEGSVSDQTTVNIYLLIGCTTDPTTWPSQGTSYGGALIAGYTAGSTNYLRIYCDNTAAVNLSLISSNRGSLSFAIVERYDNYVVLSFKPSASEATKIEFTYNGLTFCTATKKA